MEKQANCKNCGYRWKTKSIKVYTCCPSCMYKVRLKYPKRFCKRCSKKFERTSRYSFICPSCDKRSYYSEKKEL